MRANFVCFPSADEGVPLLISRIEFHTWSLGSRDGGGGAVVVAVDVLVVGVI